MTGERLSEERLRDLEERSADYVWWAVTRKDLYALIEDSRRMRRLEALMGASRPFIAEARGEVWEFRQGRDLLSKIDAALAEPQESLDDQREEN